MKRKGGGSAGCDITQRKRLQPLSFPIKFRGPDFIWPHATAFCEPLGKFFEPHCKGRRNFEGGGQIFRKGGQCRYHSSTGPAITFAIGVLEKHILQEIVSTLANKHLKIVIVNSSSHRNPVEKPLGMVADRQSSHQSQVRWHTLWGETEESVEQNSNTANRGVSCSTQCNLRRRR